MGTRLVVWGPAWGLPSADPDCMVALTYLKFAKMRALRIDATSDVSESPTDLLPVLKTSSGEVITSPGRIIAHMKKHHYNVDSELTDSEAADTLAFVAMIEEALRPAWLHTTWLEKENCSNVTWPRLTDSTGFPGNYSRARAEKRKAQKAQHGLSEKDVQDRAKECLKTLSLRLGNGDYFFGKSPTLLDAFAYGYLATIRKAPYTLSPMRAIIESHPNLIRLCERIETQHFPDADDDNTVSDSEDIDMTKVKNGLTIGIAVVGMVFYAYSYGVFGRMMRKS